MANVLVIDDTDEFREVVFDLLEELGHTAHAVSGPAAAHEYCDEHSVDVILCDLVMPLDEGQEVHDHEHDFQSADSAMVGVHAIHEFSSRFPKIPIIAMSGQMETKSLRAIETFGAVDSLTKPFRLDDLQRVLDGALGRRGQNLSV